MSYTSPDSRTLFPSLMLALLCLIWGLTFPATKAALSVCDPMHFLALRFGLATLLLAPFMLRRRKRFSGDSDAHNKPIKRIWLRGALIGLFLLLGYTLQVYGLKYTTASRSGFFTSLLTILAPILALILRTSRAHWVTWTGLIPAMTGIFLLADPEAGGLNRGDTLTIGCALAFAMQMVVLEAVVKNLEDVRILTYAQIIVVGAGALLWSLVEGKPFMITPTGWAAAGYTALFGSVIAVWMQTRYQPEVPAGHAALLFTLEPVFAAILAWLLLGEVWTIRTLFGAALILSAMILSGTGLYKTAAK